MNVIRAGTALLLSEAPLYKPHLWIVLTDPDGEPPQIVAVMIRTVSKFTDTTVILRVGDHPFIRHDSSVHYSTARHFSVHALFRAMQDGRCHLRDSVGVRLLQRLQQGLLASPFRVNAIADYCAPRFGVG